jgi:hypothetical protein
MPIHVASASSCVNGSSGTMLVSLVLRILELVLLEVLSEAWRKLTLRWVSVLA